MGKLADTLFGEGADGVPDAVFPEFTAGGVNLRNNGEGLVRATTDEDRQNLIGGIRNNLTSAGTSVRSFLPQIQDAFGRGISGTNELLAQVQPGFGRFTQAGVDAIQQNRDTALGNIRQNLSNRRVLGSSFGQNIVAQSARQFADDEAAFRSESFLQELEMTNRLQQQRTQLDVDRINSELSNTLSAFQFDVQADEVQLQEFDKLVNIANGVAVQSAEIANQVNMAKAQAEAERSAAIGEFIGTAITAGFGVPTGGFGGGGNSAAFGIGAGGSSAGKADFADLFSSGARSDIGLAASGGFGPYRF